MLISLVDPTWHNLFQFKNNGTFACAGVLIDPDWVISDSFVVDRPYVFLNLIISNQMSSEYIALDDVKFYQLFVFWRDAYQVVLGLHDFDDFENGGKPEIYDIEQILLVSIFFYKNGKKICQSFIQLYYPTFILSCT